MLWSSIASKRRQSRDEVKYGSASRGGKKEVVTDGASEATAAVSKKAEIPQVERKQRGGKRKTKK